MADRTVKMYGKVYGENVSVVASFNNNEIINGTVTSVNSAVVNDIDWADLDVIVEFTISTDVSGNVPFSITPTGGAVVFHTFHANYNGDETDENGDVVTPGPNWFTDLSHTAPSPDTGHNNITVDGVAQVRNTEAFPNATGVWNWIAGDGETLAMDILVSPAVV